MDRSEWRAPANGPWPSTPSPTPRSSPSSPTPSTASRCPRRSSRWSHRRLCTPTCAAPTTTAPGRRPEMLIQQTFEKMEAIGLGAMAAALRDQIENPNQYLELTFEDRLGLLVDREADWRDSRRFAIRLKAAK